MRIFKLIVMMMLVLAIAVPHDAEAKRKNTRTKRAAPASWGVNDPRYAALIMDPKTGEIYHEKNSTMRRYPASLTKMMTLYLLFEALESDKISMHTRLPVSEYAASMPQTNLSLSAGDEIPVETAIKSLVVRSANDVSVVVAEALGGDVDNFATMMTIKAHALGMRSTRFANPNGLPNENQYTTARDMAKLGIALKRDFPKYYPYFSVREFSWAGTSYYTHNRVMLRYAGVDGIKTGYIGSSGFNLVTYCKRGGRPLIGVVMGGSSGRWRDDRMIALLGEGYQVLASRGASRGKMYASNLPRSTNATIGENKPIAFEEEESPPIDTPENEVDELTKPTPPAAPALSSSKPAPTSPFAAPTPPPSAPSLSMATNWGIQVGAFSTNALAQKAANSAQKKAAQELAGARSVIIPPKKPDKTYRVRLENITEFQATKACEVLSSANMQCFTYRADP